MKTNPETQPSLQMSRYRVKLLMLGQYLGTSKKGPDARPPVNKQLACPPKLCEGGSGQTAYAYCIGFGGQATQMGRFWRCP